MYRIARNSIYIHSGWKDDLKRPERRSFRDLTLSLKSHVPCILARGGGIFISGPDIELINDLVPEDEREVRLLDVFSQVVPETRKHGLSVRRSHMMRQPVLRRVDGRAGRLVASIGLRVSGSYQPRLHAISGPNLASFSSRNCMLFAAHIPAIWIYAICQIAAGM